MLVILTHAIVRTCPQCLRKGPHPKLLLGPILVAVVVAVAVVIVVALAAVAAVVAVAVEQALNQ